ncbi:MAG: 5-formyltetrahydrofolate cyclo-ligase [Sedimentisphaerales bacterium]|nr:5-formyltetrahydrofolate cyclo-ligase [Sedimentisphaerales bacterium]
MNNAEQKRQLRKQIQQILVEIQPEVRVQKSRAICTQVLSLEDYQKASVVMLFLSMLHEVDTTAMILDAFQQGKTVAVPKMSWQQRHMIPVEIHSLDSGLQVDRMGLRNPTTGMPVPPEDIDLVIVPGLGFDRQGNRLGRGAAYYDRFLGAPGMRAKKWAVAFSEQILDAVPHDDKDVAMDAIVTEAGIIRIQSR